jgi:uncharacterized protein
MDNHPVRFSAFTARIRDGESIVWFHSLTGAVMRLPAHLAEALERLLAAGTVSTERLAGSPLESLLHSGFLVGADVDEYEREHRAYLKARNSPRQMLLTVAPTLACNLRCSYCFQRGMPPSRMMSRPVADGLVDLVGALGDVVRPERVVVQWFGGEPLLAFDLLLRCTEGFRAQALQPGFEYCAEIITNGILLQRAGILRDLHRLHLVSLQISLDGLPATYAARKEVTVARATRFYEFLADTVGRLADVTGQVILRVNVDRQNVGEAREVVDFFVNRGVADPRVIFKLGRLGSAPGSSDCIPHDCLETDGFTEEEIIFLEHLTSHGLITSAGVPEPIGSTCGAILRHQYSVDPSGRIGKCVPLIGTGEDTISVIHPGDIARTVHELTARPHPFADFDPYRAARCRGCHLLPVCLGSCPREDGTATGACLARHNLERQVLASIPC